MLVISIPSGDGMKRTQEESKILRQRAYKLHLSGVSKETIAKTLKVSVRMVYRYIDAERLSQLEDRLAQMRTVRERLSPSARKEFDSILKKLNNITTS